MDPSLYRVSPYEIISMRDCSLRLHDATGYAVKSERGWRGVRATPRSLETGFHARRASGRYRAVHGSIDNSHRASCLREIAVPAYYDHLPVGKREAQCPAVHRCSSCVRNSKASLETAGPLADYAVVNLATRTRWSRRGRRSRSRGWRRDWTGSCNCRWRWHRRLPLTTLGVVHKESVHGISSAWSFWISIRAAAAAT